MTASCKLQPQSDASAGQRPPIYAKQIQTVRHRTGFERGCREARHNAHPAETALSHRESYDRDFKNFLAKSPLDVTSSENSIVRTGSIHKALAPNRIRSILDRPQVSVLRLTSLSYLSPRGATRFIIIQKINQILWLYKRKNISFALCCKIKENDFYTRKNCLKQK